MTKRRKPAPPPNLAAKALSHGLFRPKVIRNKKLYTRKGRQKDAPSVIPDLLHGPNALKFAIDSPMRR